VRTTQTIRSLPHYQASSPSITEREDASVPPLASLEDDTRGVSERPPLDVVEEDVMTRWGSPGHATPPNPQTGPKAVICQSYGCVNIPAGFIQSSSGSEMKMCITLNSDWASSCRARKASACIRKMTQEPQNRADFRANRTALPCNASTRPGNQRVAIGW
jgi:hypothetical protein